MPASSSLSELSHLLQVLLACEVRDEDVQSIHQILESPSTPWSQGRPVYGPICPPFEQFEGELLLGAEIPRPSDRKRSCSGDACVRMLSLKRFQGGCFIVGAATAVLPCDDIAFGPHSSRHPLKPRQNIHASHVCGQKVRIIFQRQWTSPFATDCANRSLLI